MGDNTFAYDFNDRLIQSNINGLITQYSYDGLGNRLSKTADGTAKIYILDVNGSLSNVLAETDSTGAITARYVYGLGLISKILPDNTTMYYHYDSRGSTVALTDAGETITDTYAYKPFGTLSSSAGSTRNPFKYAGRYGVMDDGNGLNYIRARYYMPKIGRFITKYLFTGENGDSQSLNRYVYVSNNPVMFMDPWGLCKEGWGGIGIDVNIGMGLGNSDSRSLSDSYGGGVYIGARGTGHAELGAFAYKQRTNIQGVRAGAGLDLTVYYNATAEQVFNGVTRVKVLTIGHAAVTKLYDNSTGNEIGTQISVYGLGGGLSREQGRSVGRIFPLQ